MCALLCVLQDNIWRPDNPKASLLQFVRGKLFYSRHLFYLRGSAFSCSDSFVLLEFECHLDLQANSSNHVCSKWRMKIQTEQNKPQRKQMSIAREFIVSFTIIKHGVTIVYIGKEFECIR